MDTEVHGLQIVAVQSHGSRKVRYHRAFTRNLIATVDGDTLTVTLAEPTIPDTDWQGATITEALTVTMSVDGEQAGTIDLVDGTASLDLDPGNHIVTVSAVDANGTSVEATA